MTRCPAFWPLISPPPARIPLNDDAEEKARRLHSRQALQEAHVNKLKAAAATPLRKGSVNLNDLENDSPASPPQRQKTPRPRARTIENVGDDDDVVVAGNAVTPMKRVPILANFEEWMKMATDNKINATNSWNFALIDYFHDMSLLKEGDGVNFQKASCTLDGCVKIYTSRVDSVATETGKLLSGLADSRDSKKKRGEGDDGEGEDSEEEVDEDGNVRKKPKRKVNKSGHICAETSLANSCYRLKDHQKLHWRRHLHQYSSRNLSWNSLWILCSRKRQRTLMRAVPRVSC